MDSRARASRLSLSASKANSSKTTPSSGALPLCSLQFEGLLSGKGDSVEGENLQREWKLRIPFLEFNKKLRSRVNGDDNRIIPESMN